MQGIMFNGETPMMSGTWYNPKTKDSFVVRNTFFENNQMVVQTMDGRMLEYNQLQHYVQADGPMPVDFSQPKPQVNNSLPPEVANLIDSNDHNDLLLQDDYDMINKPLGNIYDKPTAAVEEQVHGTPLQPVEDVNSIIISKALDKFGKPKATVKLDKKSLPKEPIKILMDMMGISKEDIVMWYMNKLDIESLYQDLKESVEKTLDEKLKEKE